MTKITNRAVAEALKRMHGNISAAAAALQVTRRAIRLRIDADPRLEEALTDAREGMVDNAESKLAIAVLEGDMGAVKYVLSALGKNRGYVERTEVVEATRVSLEIVEEIVEAPAPLPPSDAG